MSFDMRRDLSIELSLSWPPYPIEARQTVKNKVMRQWILSLGVIVITLTYTVVPDMYRSSTRKRRWNLIWVPYRDLWNWYIRRSDALVEVKMGPLWFRRWKNAQNANPRWFYVYR